MDLVTFVASQLQIDIEEHRVRSALQEALLVGNIVRHGEGWPMDEIRDQAPHLIDRSKTQYVDLIGQETPDSEWVKIGPMDLDRYVRAMIRFWELADKEPFAVTSIFVGES